MATLFSTEKAFADNLITLVRPLTLDDVVIEDVTSPEVPSDIRWASYTKAGSTLTLKQSHIDELLTLANISTTENGSYANNNIGIFGLTDGWESKKPLRYNAYKERSVEYRGLRSTKTKLERFAKVRNALVDEVNEMGNVLINAALEDITQDIQATIDKNNQRVRDNLRRIIVELNVKDTSRFLNDEEKASITEKEQEEADLEKEIKSLREQLKTKRNEIYTIKREALTRSALEGLGEQGQAIVKSLDEEKPEPRNEMILL